MTAFSLLAVSFIMNVVAVLFVVCCLALILIVLIQKGRGGGLSGAFGGAMAGGILGSKTGDFLTWVTIVLAGVFLGLAIIMAKFYRQDMDYTLEQPVQQQSSTSQRPSPTIDEVQTKPDTTVDINTLSGSETGLPEVPMTAEQEQPTDSTMSESGGAGDDSDVNLPVE
jgi:preprotein translocase subunit SecG